MTVNVDLMSMVDASVDEDMWWRVKLRPGAAMRNTSPITERAVYATT